MPCKTEIERRVGRLPLIWPSEDIGIKAHLLRLTALSKPKLHMLLLEATCFVARLPTTPKLVQSSL